MSRPRKHSLTLGGHRTSVTLEDEFWEAFRDIAKVQGIGVNALAYQIDRDRGTQIGLATALRLHVLRHYRGAKG
ncbi:aryl-sulfate sulfotransferase [Thioclava sp. SK-1]|uniref:ribbon-helix-helix domain-containing protein n=1 Tax=Thioclava sp. SK-1 TaxID=1889770 RepID=UPI000824AFB7|nr:ribbon-helix-helix domain-containing protein [Thioclava sp. SK-1]OCX63053.1 aryl-sulfate sulfotransferase [Thioclava sp. SK-1]